MTFRLSFRDWGLNGLFVNFGLYLTLLLGSRYVICDLAWQRATWSGTYRFQVRHFQVVRRSS